MVRLSVDRLVYPSVPAVNSRTSIEWRFAMAPMKKREGPPQSVYRYGLLLRFSLERGFVDGPLWSCQVCLPCLPFLRWWGWLWFRSFLASLLVDAPALSTSACQGGGPGEKRSLVSCLLSFGLAFACLAPGPGVGLAGARDPQSRVLRSCPNASRRSGVSLGSGHGPLGRLVLGPTMTRRPCRLLVLVAL